MQSRLGLTTWSSPYLPPSSILLIANVVSLEQQTTFLLVNTATNEFGMAVLVSTVTTVSTIFLCECCFSHRMGKDGANARLFSNRQAHHGKVERCNGPPRGFLHRHLPLCHWVHPDGRFAQRRDVRLCPTVLRSWKYWDPDPCADFHRRYLEPPVARLLLISARPSVHLDGLGGIRDLRITYCAWWCWLAVGLRHLVYCIASVLHPTVPGTFRQPKEGEAIGHHATESIPGQANWRSPQETLVRFGLLRAFAFDGVDRLDSHPPDHWTGNCWLGQSSCDRHALRRWRLPDRVPLLGKE